MFLQLTCKLPLQPRHFLSVTEPSSVCHSEKTSSVALSSRRRSGVQCCLPRYNDAISDTGNEDILAATEAKETVSECQAQHENHQRSWPDLHPVLRSFTDPTTLWNPADVTSSPLWRCLLTADGHTALQLELLLCSSVQLILLESSAIPEPSKSAYFAEHAARTKFFNHLPKPWHRRQIFFSDQCGTLLVHATSWWDASYYEKIMADDPLCTTWQAISSRSIPVSRDILGVYFGFCKSLEQAFQKSGPFWSRDIIFKRNSRPFIIISEIFSPSLERYIGKMSYPVGMTSMPTTSTSSIHPLLP